MYAIRSYYEVEGGVGDAGLVVEDHGGVRDHASLGVLAGIDGRRVVQGLKGTAGLYIALHGPVVLV